MSASSRGRRNTHVLNARLDTQLDADLIAWLEAQPHGKRSEAIRELMREGLQMRQLEGHLAAVVRQAVAEALAGVQVEATQQGMLSDTNEAEEAFGAQLDQLLGGFG